MNLSTKKNWNHALVFLLSMLIIFSFTLQASGATLAPVVTEHGKINISVERHGTLGSGTIPTINASRDNADYTKNDFVIDPGIVVESAININNAKIFIGDGYVSGEDQLIYSLVNGITGNFDTATGVLTLTGDRPASEYQEAFRSVIYNNNNEDPGPPSRNITFVLGGNSLYCSDTEHYYESIHTSSQISWTSAKAEAEGRSLFGMQGYLATITSAEENTFLGSKVPANAWIGASDAAVEGQWRWVTGPEGSEDSGQGRLFYSGARDGFAVNGEYNNWCSCEPNDNNGEDYAHMYGSWLTNEWNDYPNSLNIMYYLVEYGGMAGDPEITPQLTATITINLIPVNDAPTTPGSFLSPTSGQVKPGGQPINLNWGTSTDPEVDSVKYDLWFFNGSWTQIGSLLNTNNMSFTLPEDDISNAMFRVYATDTTDNSSARDVIFTIDSSTPLLDVSGSPLTWQNSSVEINVSVTDISTETVKWASGIRDLDYFASSGNVINFPYSFTATSNGNYTVYTIDDVGYKNLTTFEVTKVDTDDPSVVFLDNGNSSYANNHSTVVTVTDANSGVQTLEYSWSQDSNEGAVDSWTEFTSGDLLTKDSVNGDWYLHVKAVDNVTNVNYSISNVFKFDKIPTINASRANADYIENDVFVIDPEIVVDSTANITKAKVFIGDGYVYEKDQLIYSSVNGITGNFDTATGVLTLTGDHFASEYQEAFRNVIYMNNNDNPSTSPRNISFVLGEDALYCPATGHYYESIHTSSQISWTSAKAEAEGRSLFGMQGYLATITSAEENTFLGSKVPANAWIGASDAAVEGQWKWITGPEGSEDGGQGRLFYSGARDGSAVNGEYNNWASSEPNDCGSGEDYAHMYGDRSTKEWNDYPDSLNVDYYLVEYGGISEDPEITPQLTATITINVISVNDAPTTPGIFVSPTSGQVKPGRQSINLNWSASTDPEGDPVKYDLWFFNGSWTQIGSLLNTNNMPFTLPEDDISNAMFRVYANDTNDNSSARDVTFTIDSSAPLLDVSGSPLTWQNSSVEINVSVTDISIETVKWASGIRDLDYFTSSGNVINSPYIFKATSNGNYTVYAIDDIGHKNLTTFEVTKVDTDDPSVVFLDNGNSSFANNHSTVVTVTDANSGVQTLEYSWSLNSSKESVDSWTEFNSGDILSQDSVNGDWYLHVRATDYAGNINQSVSNVFKLDNTPPTYNWANKIVAANTGETISIELNATDNTGISLYNITVNGKEYEMEQNDGNYLYNISIPASDSGTLVSSIIYNCTFSDLAGNTNSTGDIPVRVSILPVADFSANVTRGTNPLAVNFTDNSSGLVENWYWDFGDGNLSTNHSSTHVFDSGNFTVNLTVTNGNGSSTKFLNVRDAYEPVYTLSPANPELISKYGEEMNFSINSSLFSSYEWFIDGVLLGGPGITLYDNTEGSSKYSVCIINTSQYINQRDFFMDVYNVSVNVKNESIGRTDRFSWQWTVTNSSADEGKEIDFVINKTPKITSTGGEKCVRFNTTDDEKSNDEGIACSINTVQFNTTNKTDGIQIKVEVLDKSSINESGIDFSKDSVYQYLDISFNNETLANDGSNNRSIEFRVLNELDSGTLIIKTVYLRHRGSLRWESYEPELIGNDGTYSYFIVRNISGFSPFAVTCKYKYKYSSASISDGGLPAYLKMMMFRNESENIEENSRTEELETTNSESIASFERITKGSITAKESNNENINNTNDSNNRVNSNKLTVMGIALISLIAILFIIFRKRKKENDE